MTAAVLARAAFACDDIQQDPNGRLVAIGLMNPILGLGEIQALLNRPTLGLHFLLSLDVKQPGTHQLVFRLRGLTAPHGHMVTMNVQFTWPVRNIPFPVGPVDLLLADEKCGFCFEQRVGERWQVIAVWHFLGWGSSNREDWGNIQDPQHPL